MGSSCKQIKSFKEKVLQYISLIIQISNMLPKKLLVKQSNSPSTKFCHHSTKNDKEVTNNEGQPEDAVTQEKICISSVDMLKTPLCRRKLLKKPATQPHTQRQRYVLCFSYKTKFDQSGNRSFFLKMGRSLKILLNLSMRVTLFCCSLLDVLGTRPLILTDMQRENKMSVWEMLYIVSRAGKNYFYI